MAPKSFRSRSACQSSSLTVEKLAARDVAGVVDEQVEAAEASERRRNQLLHVGWLHYVGDHGHDLGAAVLGDRRRRLLERLPTTCADHDPRALASERALPWRGQYLRSPPSQSRLCRAIPVPLRKRTRRSATVPEGSPRRGSRTCGAAVGPARRARRAAAPSGSVALATGAGACPPAAGPRTCRGRADRGRRLGAGPAVAGAPPTAAAGDGRDCAAAGPDAWQPCAGRRSKPPPGPPTVGWGSRSGWVPRSSWHRRSAAGKADRWTGSRYATRCSHVQPLPGWGRPRGWVRDLLLALAALAVAVAAAWLTQVGTFTQTLITIPLAQSATELGGGDCCHADGGGAPASAPAPPPPASAAAQRQPASNGPASAQRVAQEQAQRAALDRLAEGLQQTSATRGAGQAMARGDYSSAANQLNDLGTQADQLSDAAKQQLGQTLQRTASESSGDRQLAQREQQAAEALQRGDYSAPAAGAPAAGGAGPAQRCQCTNLRPAPARPGPAPGEQQRQPGTVHTGERTGPEWQRRQQRSGEPGRWPGAERGRDQRRRATRPSRAEAATRAMAARASGPAPRPACWAIRHRR